MGALKTTVAILDQDNLDLLHAKLIGRSFDPNYDNEKPNRITVNCCVHDIHDGGQKVDQICGHLIANDSNFARKLEEIQVEMLKQIECYNLLIEQIIDIANSFGYELVSYKHVKNTAKDDVVLMMQNLVDSRQILHDTVEKFSLEQAHRMDENVMKMEMEQMELLKKFKEVADEAKELRKKVLMLKQSRIVLNKRLKAAMADFVDSKVDQAV